jgi:hypothetical protein
MGSRCIGRISLMMGSLRGGFRSSLTGRLKSKAESRQLS